MIENEGKDGYSQVKLDLIAVGVCVGVCEKGVWVWLLLSLLLK